MNPSASSVVVQPERPVTTAATTTVSGVVKCVAYVDGCRDCNLDLERIHEVLRQPDRFVWIGLHEPCEETLRKVQEEFCLHDLAIEDAHCAHQRPKIETYGDGLFIVLRTAHRNQETGRVEFGETHFFVGERYLVSVRHGSSLSYTDVRARCEAKPQLLRRGPGFALYALMDSIVDQYFPLVNALEEELQTLEDKIFGEEFSRDTTAQIYQLKRDLLEIKRSVSPLIDICNRLMRFDVELIPEDTRPYFRDVCDHAMRINEMVDILRELLTTALEANFSLTSISQNEVTKRLASWAAIIALPTMVAGIYGMNFKAMPELNWDYGYPVILVLTVLACVFIYSRFKRSGWL